MQETTLTRKQQETLEFIRRFRIQNNQSPTITELSDGLRLKSLRSVTQRLEQLERKGFIRRDLFKHRSIALLDHINPISPFGTTRIPVIASAGCDAAEVYAEERYDEYVSIDDKLIDNRKEIVAIKAVGNSMIDAGINNGDYVLTEVTEDVSNGDRVVAVIGDMAVIKRLKRVEGAVILEPESKGNGYQPIIMHDNFKIFGKVLSVIPGSYHKNDVDFVYEPGYRKNM